MEKVVFLFPFLFLLELLLNNQIVVFIILQGKISQLLLNVWTCVVWENQIDDWRSCIEGTYKAFLQCKYGGVFLNVLLDWTIFRTLYSGVTSPRCGWADVKQDVILWLKCSRKIYTDLAFLRNVLWCGLWECLQVQTHNRIVCTYVASPHCEWAYAFSSLQFHQMNFRIVHICELSLQCG